MSFFAAESVTVTFGGLRANNNVSFTLNEGQVVGLIGPNGAGKTTLFNCLTGFQQPDEGKVTYRGTVLTGRGPDEINRLGIARTFQIPKTFRTMTVLENVTVGALKIHPRLPDAIQAAERVLDFAELSHRSDVPGHALTLADRKRLEIARALATEPELLMLDEAMAGLNSAEIEAAIKLVQKIKEHGVTVILVEHVMEVVMTLAERLLVLDRGELIAEGDPRTVSEDPKVIQAYLGESWSA